MTAIFDLEAAFPARGEFSSYSDLRDDVAVLSVEPSLSDEILTAAFGGETDGRLAVEFTPALSDVLSNARQTAPLGLTGISFMGNAGLRALSDFRHMAQAEGLDWAMPGGYAVVRPLQSVGLEVPAYATMRKAQAAVEPAVTITSLSRFTAF